jgi:FlaA1/EpsC-like NDP-sugar epimerase
VRSISRSHQDAPTLQEIIEGRVNIIKVRDVRIKDLLGRESVEMTHFDQEFHCSYTRKRMLAKGRERSIGSDVVRQFLLVNLHSVAWLDENQNSCYEPEQELVFRFPEARIAPEIADVPNRDRLLTFFRAQRPLVVFHAASYKHVLLKEKHSCKAVLNNVRGKRKFSVAARVKAAERFVFVSADKDVNPTSVTGASKQVGESLTQFHANDGRMRCMCLRFGNAMRAAEASLPLLKKQIAEGGTIIVTYVEAA